MRLLRAFTMPQKPKKLIDRVRDAILVKHYSYRTEQTYTIEIL